MYKKCTSLLQSSNYKRLETCINNVQTKQNLYNYLTKTKFICFLYVHTMYKLYKMYTNVN